MEKIALRCSQKFFNLHDSTHFHISPHSHHNFMTFIAQTFTSKHVSLNTLHVLTHFTHLTHSFIQTFTLSRFTYSIIQPRTQIILSFHTKPYHAFIDSFTRPLNHKHKYQLTNIYTSNTNYNSRSSTSLISTFSFQKPVYKVWIQQHRGDLIHHPFFVFPIQLLNFMEKVRDRRWCCNSSPAPSDDRILEDESC